MKIGVRYCGGCNPGYDRVGLINGLKGLYPGMEWGNAEPEGVYDMILEVTGCGKPCISEWKGDRNVRIVHVDRAEDEQTVRDILDNCSQA